MSRFVTDYTKPKSFDPFSNKPPKMRQQENLEGQAIKMDFGNDVPNAFDHLPINRQLNIDIMRRAVERAKAKLKTESK